MLETACKPVFDDLASLYDRLVDWPKRLAREGPFFRDLFARNGVRRVLDAACGTGHHAALFHSWGLEIVGTDISSAMIDSCIKLHGESGSLQWRRQSFAAPLEDCAPFDAVVCLGNSLALADGFQGVRDAIAGMMRSLRPGGVGVIQVVNLESMEAGPTQWQKVERYDEDGQPVVLMKGIHRCGGRGFVDLVKVRLSSTSVSHQARAVSFLGLRQLEITAVIQERGGVVDHVYGSYALEEFTESRSGDLILVWQQGGKKGCEN